MTAASNFGRKAIGIFTVAILALLFTGMTNGLSAQTQEGVTITNTASAAFTDANGNTYTAATGQVTVTVAFLGALDVSSPATQSPLSPSTGNVAVFDIANGGNGTDTVTVGLTVSNTSVTNVTELRYVDAGGDTLTVPFLTDLATTVDSLNVLLDADSIPLGDTVQVLVVYSVGSSQGDNTSNVVLTATSQRTGGDNDSSTTAVTPPTTGTVTVLSVTDSINRLPASGETYTAVFNVQNASSTAQLIDLSADTSAVNGTGLVIVSVNGNPGASETGVSFTQGETKAIIVVYTTANGSGETTLTLSASGQTVGSGSDTHVVTGISPAISVTKSVHGSKANAQAGTPDLVGNPQPGDTIWYRVTVANTGTAPAIMTGTNDAATAMQITDDLTGLPVTYVPSSLDSTGSTTAFFSLQIFGDLITGIINSLPVSGNAFFVFGVTIN